jgi:hypothetical protein
VRRGQAGLGSVRQGVTWLANCGSFPQQVNPTVRRGMAGQGSAGQGSVYQSGGIANSQGSAGPGSMRRGQVVFGKVRLGKVVFKFNRRL